jgi:NAD/NADP transhydrogenase alpha subunit
VTDALLGDLTVLALAIFIGYEVISKVPVILHTPLMSGTNAIHGIVLVGFLVTDRMLLMFAKKRPGPAAPPGPEGPLPK